MTTVKTILIDYALLHRAERQRERLGKETGR